MLHPAVFPSAVMFDAPEFSPTSDANAVLHSWSFEPGIVLPLALFALLYLAGALRRGGGGRMFAQHTCFWLGWVVLALSVVSPLHALGEQLFSAHMLQHELMILVAAPLIAAAHPGATCVWAFSPRGRVAFGVALRSIGGWRISRWLMLPLVAWLVHAIALWGWHLPALYQASVRNDTVHAVQHLSFFLSALLFWSALYGIGQSARSYGAGVFYVFGTALHCGALGALLTFSTVLWYPIYSTTTAAWRLTPLEDQQLGGLIMWVPSGVVFIAVGLVLFARWLRESDQRVAHGELQSLVRAGTPQKNR